jgi:hypothetical protein
VADLDLGLDIIDGVAALDLDRDGLPRQRQDEELHLVGYDPRSGARVTVAYRVKSPKQKSEPNEEGGSRSVD